MTNDYGNLELHKVLLSAMKDIDKICRENGLRYYIYAGTVLGAVQHGGFIPWDDDADVVMFKEDYDKFVKIINERYSDIYFIQTFESDPEWYSKMSKLRVKGTKNIGYHENTKTHNEIFIDINPLYNVPDNKLLRFSQRKSIEFINLVLAVKSGEVECQSIITKSILLPLSKLRKKFWGNILGFILEKLGKGNSENIGIMCNTLTKSQWTGNSGYDSDVMLRSGYENPVYLKFEDTYFSSSGEWENDLIRLYTENYKKPYPQEKRVTKHDIKEYYISDEVRERVGL